MDTRLLDIKKHFPPALVSKLASDLGESENAVLKCLLCLIPTTLAGVVAFSGKSTAFEIQEHESQNTLTEIFGEKLPAVTNAVASFANVQPVTVMRLMDFATPVAMDLLNQGFNSGANPEAYWKSRESEILSLMPASVAAVLGLTNSRAAMVRQRPARGLDWFWAMLWLWILGLAAMWAMRILRGGF